MSKEKYCANILRYYSILVEYKGDEDKVNVPLPIEKSETLAHWKQRVLGSDVSDVKVYMPIDISGNTLLSTIQNKIDSRHIARIFNNLRKEKNQEKEIAVEKTKQKFTKFSIQKLEEIVDDLEFTLEEPVREFLEKYMQDNSEVKTEELIEKLVKLYNEAARQFRLSNQLPTDKKSNEN